jgi:hypothetical protein
MIQDSIVWCLRAFWLWPNERSLAMKYKLCAALLAVALVSQVVLAQEKPAAAKGPPPRFISVKSVDEAKGEVVFDVQVVAQKRPRPANDSRVPRWG